MIRRVMVSGAVNPFRGGAIGKPSLNRANLSGAIDAKPGELPMGRLKRP